MPAVPNDQDKTDKKVASEEEGPVFDSNTPTDNSITESDELSNETTEPEEKVELVEQNPLHFFTTPRKSHNDTENKSLMLFFKD